MGDNAITLNIGQPKVLKNVSQTFNDVLTLACINLELGRMALAPKETAAGATTLFAICFIPTINSVAIDFL